MRRVQAVIAALVMAIGIVFMGAAPVQAEPICYYDYFGKRICVSENGAEVPEGTLWFCVIYTFSGGQICVSSDGQVAEYPEP